MKINLENLKLVLLVTLIGYLFGLIISPKSPLVSPFVGLSFAVFRLKNLKKYFRKENAIDLNVSLLVVLSNALLYFMQKFDLHLSNFISSLSKYYLDEHVYSFSLTSILVLLFLISMILLFHYFFDEDKVIRIVKSFVYTIVLFPLLAPIVFYTALWVNRQGAMQEIVQDFCVSGVYRDAIEIESLGDYYLLPNHKFQNSGLKSIKKNDTIQVVFKMGIFGIKYMNKGKITLKE